MNLLHLVDDPEALSEDERRFKVAATNIISAQ